MGWQFSCSAALKMRTAAVIFWLIFSTMLVDSFNLGFGPPMVVGTWKDRTNFILHRKQLKTLKRAVRSKGEKARAEKKHKAYLTMTARRRKKKFLNDRLMHSVRLL